MSLQLDASVEKIIRQRAESEGVSVDDLLARTFAPKQQTDPAERVRRRLDQWNASESPAVLKATSELFQAWDEADAEMTAEEREAEDRLWHSVLEGLEETRQQLGMRPLRA